MSASSDIEIAHRVTPRPIVEVAQDLGTDRQPVAARPAGRVRITVTDVYGAAGAGFVVAKTGDITMPGPPKVPAAEGMSLTPDGRILGLS